MSTTHVMVAAWATAIASVAIAVVHHVGRSLTAPDGWLACSAFAAPIAAAAVLAFVGVRTDHPSLWLSAGVALAVSAFTWTFAIPLLIPAVVMICTESDRFRLSVPAILAAALAAMFGFMALKEGPLPALSGQDRPLLFETSGDALLMLGAAAMVAILGVVWALLSDPVPQPDAA